ncbi:MAG: asparagine synthase (glutamine-hydrolyzing) [Flavisolibacter sp.]|nr:asparagine synthase (glutamine-hydrolyzing) [Flavisolibacter sp.]
MCGIAGIISRNKERITQQRLQQATDAIVHRGPEGEGFWINEKHTVALGHRRLAIIDVSECARQPMYYKERYIIIHNGELYNYTELRKELEQKGFPFTTQSDTEVIVAAYAAWGAECLQQFDGMFAFAIWDEEEQTLFAARDRFGEKPFFFFYNNEEFLFASEMKALWAAGVAKEVNHSLLYNFLTIGYTANPADPSETFFKHIQKLPPASYLQYTTSTHRLLIGKYWQLNVAECEDIKENEAVEQLRHLLQESVQKRLRSDVPIGTSLSGGLDSSSIVALCAQQKATQYTHMCFTAVFPDFQKNEQTYAAQVAEQYKLMHHLVEIRENDIPHLMHKVAYHQEEPFSSASALAQYGVYQKAKQEGITVLLDGQGADEVLAGYHKHYKWRWQDLYRHKKLKRSGELSAARKLDVQESFDLKNKAAALFPHLAAALWQTTKSKSASRQPFLHPDFAFAHKRDLYYSLPTTPDLNGALYFNTFVYGLEELLHYADRNSMAHATEIRLPFLQHQLVEFLFSLPAHFKIHNGWTKWLLRIAMEPYLPQDIVWRRDKVGFEPPQQKWMQLKSVQEQITAAKEKLVREKILNASVLPKKIQPHAAHAADPFDWRFWSAGQIM